MSEAAAIVGGLQAEIAKQAAKAKRDQWEDELAFQVRAHRLPAPARQHRFALELGRQWRFDFAWPQPGLMVAVEFEGLVATKAMLPKAQGRGYRETFILTGRHVTPEGFKEDVEKYNAATLLGWRLLRFHRDQVKSGTAIATLERLLHSLGWRREGGA